MPPGSPTDGVHRLADGVRIGYTLVGDPGCAHRVALIHSLAMDREFWRPVATQLSARACVLIPDCRGHGASDKPAGPYTVGRFADDLAELFDHLGWRDALVAGASMGGCVALAFAAAHPARTAALGLVDTTAWYGPQAPAQWAERAERALEAGLDSLVEFQTTRWFGETFRAANPGVVADCVRRFVANDVAAYAQSCRMLGDCDLREALPRIAAPAAVLVGEEDYATPLAMAQALHSGIRGATLEVLPGARHLTPLEAPAAVGRFLANLLERIAA